MGKSGLFYVPENALARKVCKPGDFRFSVAGLDHGHIYGMTTCLVQAGADLVKVWDPDPAKVEKFRGAFPAAKAARAEAELLDDRTIQMVATACVPCMRGPFGLRVLAAGKNFFSDKTPFTTHAQLEAARAKVASSRLKWSVFYSERIQNEAGVKAGELVKAGEIGRMVQLIGLGPHRLNPKERPDWFFKRENYGGILCDIGSHQAEQFLFYSGARKARVVSATARNFSHPEYPEFEDYGEALIEADNGARQFMRVDWLTPDGLPTWGDGRTIILGTKGYIELRKYLDLARDNTESHLYIVNEGEPRYIACHGKVGFPYFGELILDILNGTDIAMPQEHVFMAAQLCLDAQRMADAERAVR